MTLIALKEYLMHMKIVSLSMLQLHFQSSDSELLRDMLRIWVRKGRVRCFKKTAFCGGKCVQCDVAVTEMYEWMV